MAVIEVWGRRGAIRPRAGGCGDGFDRRSMSARVADSVRRRGGSSVADAHPRRPAAGSTLLSVPGASCLHLGGLTVCGEYVGAGAFRAGLAGGLHCRRLDRKEARAVRVRDGPFLPSDVEFTEQYAVSAARIANIRFTHSVPCRRLASALDCTPECARAAICHVLALEPSTSAQFRDSSTLHRATGAVLKRAQLVGVAALASSLLYALFVLTLHYGAGVATVATAVLDWLVRWPAGIKLNGPVTQAAGRFFHLFLEAQTLIVRIIQAQGSVFLAPPPLWTATAGAGALLLCRDHTLALAPEALARLATGAHGPLVASNALFARSLAALVRGIGTAPDSRNACPTLAPALVHSHRHPRFPRPQSQPVEAAGRLRCDGAAPGARGVSFHPSAAAPPPHRLGARRCWWPPLG